MSEETLRAALEAEAPRPLPHGRLLGALREMGVDVPAPTRWLLLIPGLWRLSDHRPLWDEDRRGTRTFVAPPEEDPPDENVLMDPPEDAAETVIATIYARSGRLVLRRRG